MADQQFWPSLRGSLQCNSNSMIFLILTGAEAASLENFMIHGCHSLWIYSIGHPGIAPKSAREKIMPFSLLRKRSVQRDLL